MITLSKSGGTVTFTFDGNSTYLQNGTIEVPLNSLSLIVDESGMATFRKSASNDIFVSALYSEFGMTKAELEAWYKENMVGSTSGGGGITSGEVQTMIDESISGLAESSAVTLEISEAVSGKQDTLIAGEHITISGNVISAEAGTVPYDGYSYIEIFTGSTMGLDKIETPFYVVSGSRFCFDYKGNGEQPWGDYTCALLDWTNHTSSFQEQGAEEFVSVTWDAKYNAFKFDTLQEGHDITHVSGRNNWGYGVDVIPSGTTNETFDNVIEYVIDSDNALNSNLSSKFNNYLTTSAASNTYLAKENSAAIKYTQGMFESGQTNINGGIISIQNGFENYVINTPLGNYNYPSSYGKGILRESFVLGMGSALSVVLWGDNEDGIFGIPQAEVFNGGLVGRKVFIIWDGGYTSAIYFKCENASITSGETQIDFRLSGKIYFDDECTKEYKSYPNWFIQGTVTKDGEVNGYFSAQQLERDGFFGDKTQNQGIFYDENGNTHQVRSSFNTYSTLGGRYHQGLSIFTYCLVNQNISGNYYSYILDGSLVSYQSRRFSLYNGFSNNYMNVNVPFVDYSKLSPLGFEYVVNDDSTDSRGVYGIKYRKQENQGYGASLSIDINGTTYTLVEYSETEHDLVYNDESVSGVYTITIDGDGYRTLMSNVNAHCSISIIGDGGGVDRPTTYYLHYSNGTSQEGITSGEVQSMIDSSISGKVDTSAITTSVTSASTDSEIPTAKAVFDAIPQGGGGGGGTTYTAGSGISITNDTISVFKPIFVRNDINSVAIGQSAQTFAAAAHMSLAVGTTNTINKSSSVAFGETNTIGGQTSAAIGVYNKTSNEAELAVGKYNNSVTSSITFGDSGNTLFSVGNGTKYNARHNAFEIRQNGDIYLSSGGTDIKLQDHLGGGGGGESCTVDSTTIFYSFSGRYSNDSLDMKVRYVVLDYAQDKTEASNVSIEVNFRDDNYNTYVSQQITLDYTTSSYTLGDISQAEYIDVTYDATIEDFKIAVATAYTSTVFVGYISDFWNGNIKVPFYTISSGSPCTVIENEIPTAISELSDSMFKGIRLVTVASQQNSISTYTETLGGDGKSSKIKLDEIDGSNSTLKPAIYVGLGTSGWTEINISQQCNIGSLKATKYRVTYNYSEFDANSMGLELIVEYAGNERYDYVNFDETQQPSLQTSDEFSAATVDWNASTKELVITYPTTIELYGIQESVNISKIDSSNCQFGQTITKLESYGEEKQALKSYVQQNRAALGGLKLVKLSQQEYDGLTTKDANTVYFIGDSNGYTMKIGDVNVS